jgi:YD repeat-containing protein
MKKILKTLIVIMFLFCVHYANGQLDMSRQNKDIEIPNTQTYDFIRYGNNVGASLYTGTVNVSIPFYTYKDRDFEIPISFDYASNGFKPNQRAGDVGLGWILNAGGCITREVRGIPDETTVFLQYQSLGGNGYGTDLFGFKYQYDENIDGLYFDDYDINLDEQGNMYCFIPKNGNYTVGYEFEPDIFHFNFMGYSGDFHLWKNKEIKVYNTNFNADELKIELFASYRGFSNIIITMGDGFCYYFGGGDFGEEYIIPSYYCEPSECTNQIVNSTLKLYKIKAPNGRIVSFDYKYYNVAINYNPKSTYACKIFAGAGVGAFNDCTNFGNGNGINRTEIRAYSLTKINIGNGPVIEFEYGTVTGEKCITSLHNGVHIGTASSSKLKKIYVRNQENKIIKECNIEYKTSIPDEHNDRIANTVYFLGSLNITGEGIYDFEYCDRITRGFPVLGTFSIDHWGYYNGRSDQGGIESFAQQLSYDEEYYTETITTTKRNIDDYYNYAGMGMLRQITYPTGGYSLFEYENHDYSKRVYRTTATIYTPILSYETDKKLTGGMRIKKITNYLATDVIANTKEYLYEISNGTSSGILLNFPRYGIKYEVVSSIYNGFVQYQSLYDYFKYDGTHIEYSKVTEKRNDGSKIEYFFNNYNNYQDEMIYEKQDKRIIRYYTSDNGYFNSVIFNIKRNADHIINICTPLSSKQPFRGKLINKNIISDSGYLLRTETNNFNYNTIYSYDVPVFVSEYTRMITRQDLNTTLQSNTITDYFGSNSVSNSIFYTYNSHGQVSTTTRIDSKGDKIITKQKYVTELANPTGIYKKMLDNNVINEPIEDSVYIIKSGTTDKTLLEWRKYNYYQPNTSQDALIRLQSVDEYDKKEFAWVKTSTFVHDKNGRVLEQTDRNGIKTSYIWGYNGLYLVAKISNCSLSDVKKINGLANIETTSLSTGISNYESALRSISGAEVTALEYYPFVGLKKVTDPSGKVMMYDYNATGKLRTVADDDNNLLNKYYYSTDDKN